MLAIGMQANQSMSRSMMYGTEEWSFALQPKSPRIVQHGLPFVDEPISVPEDNKDRLIVQALNVDIVWNQKSPFFLQV